MSAARSLEPWRWIGVPMVQALGVTILFGIPLRIWGLQLPEPVFPMAAVFAWGVIRPSIIAPAAIVLMGLSLDVFWGGPFGLWALCLLVAYGVVLASRSMISGQGRAALWGFYAAVTAIAFAPNGTARRRLRTSRSAGLQMDRGRLWRGIAKPAG